MMRNVISLIVLAVIVIGSFGCVERTISITSDPPGALVYLNDKEVGRTPLTTPFLWYGVYDVRLEAEGHQALWTKAEAKTPIWDTPGLDLIAEAVPNGKSRVAWHFELEPAQAVDKADLIERAVDLKQRLINEAADAGDDHVAEEAGADDEAAEPSEEE